MRETGMVIECESRQHKFLLELTDDGYGCECPICGKPLSQPRSAHSANEIYGMKTIGNAWKEKREAVKKAKRTIVIGVEADTDKLQLKLRAIAKHTEALADELDAIDNAWRCNCGSFEYMDESIHRTEDNEKIRRTRICSKCNEKYVLPVDDELPTRLEGSD